MGRKKDPTYKKIMKQMKKKKIFGFTLIELLAVIIILGVLMIIAIPSVTEYIQSSRKTAYTSTASQYVSGARTKINAAEIPMYDVDATYYVPTSCISLEKGGDSPFGEIEEGYVVVTYDGHGYDYYFTVRDSEKMGILLTSEDLLDSSKVLTGVDNIDTTIAIEGKEKIYMVENCGAEVTEKAATITIPEKGAIERNENGEISGTPVGPTMPIDAKPQFGKPYHCYDLRNGRNDYMNASFILYANGDAAVYNKETGEASFGSNAYRYENSNLINVSDGKVTASISSDGSTIDFNDGEYGLDNLWWVCKVSNDTNKIFYTARYTATITEDGNTIEATMIFYEDGSAVLSTSEGENMPLPAGTFRYEIPIKIMSNNTELVNHLDISQDGHRITFNGIVFELQK